MENNQPGYTGWGFVGGWNNYDQYVKFTVNNSTGGNKTVTLRYAAAAGNASRKISVNGSPEIVVNFAGTSGWNVFSTASFTYNFPVGTSTILVSHNSNWLNLDNLTITDAALATQAAAQSGLSVYPNPVRRQDLLHIALHADKATEADIVILNLFGEQLASSRKELQKGENTLGLPVNQLLPGSYILRIKYGEQIQTKKILISN
ncbi:T9SS type A sorting domain-containing protein [Pontibacter sp. 172403-2]|nr:T9SS type A sorting domain-containing protein [Pontibacter sp. 172403-2]